MSTTPCLAYLPGVDGTHLAGEATFDGFRDCRTILVDYPSEACKSLDDMADASADVLQREGFSDVTVFGESYGGALAQTLAMRHPDLVRQLVLLSTFTKNPAPHEGQIASFLLTRLPDKYVQWPIRVLADRLLLQELSIEQRDLFYENLKEASLKDIANRLRALSLFDSAAWLLDHGVEIQWHFGDGDTLVGWERTMPWLERNRPQDEVVIHSGSGHVIVSQQRLDMIVSARRFIGVPELSEDEYRDLQDKALSNWGKTAPALARSE